MMKLMRNTSKTFSSANRSRKTMDCCAMRSKSSNLLGKKKNPRKKIYRRLSLSTLASKFWYRENQSMIDLNMTSIFFLTLKKGNEWVWHVIDKCAAHGNHQAQWDQKSYNRFHYFTKSYHMNIFYEFLKQSQNMEDRKFV